MKKLLIVCEEKYRTYGDYLSQLISLNDDTDDKTVGIKDGEVVAQVWGEKDYKANSAHLSSNQYIIFIGHDKFIKDKSAHMKNEFSKFGMSYSWLGTQAAIYIETIVSVKEYPAFLDFALQYQENLKHLFDKGSKNEIEQKDKEGPDVGKVVCAAGEVVAVAAAPIMLKPIVAIPMLLNPIRNSNFFKTIKYRSEIERQQYSCVVMKFYLDSLEKFLNL